MRLRTGPSGKSCAAPGSLFFPSLPLMAALFTEQDFVGEKRAATCSQGSVFLLFNTPRAFSTGARPGGWPNPPKRRRGRRKSRSNGRGVRETGGGERRSLENIRKVVSDKPRLKTDFPISFPEEEISS